MNYNPGKAREHKSILFLQTHVYTGLTFIRHGYITTNQVDVSRCNKDAIKVSDLIWMKTSDWVFSPQWFAVNLHGLYYLRLIVGVKHNPEGK